MKRLISAHIAEELQIMEQIKDYWNITKNELGLINKSDCKNSILEYLQFIGTDYDKIENDIDEIVENIYLQTVANRI